MVLNIAQSHVSGQFDVWERMRMTRGAKKDRPALGRSWRDPHCQRVHPSGGGGVSWAEEVKGASEGAVGLP